MVWNGSMFFLLGLSMGSSNFVCFELLVWWFSPWGRGLYKETGTWQCIRVYGALGWVYRVWKGLGIGQLKIMVILWVCKKLYALKWGFL